MNSRPYWRISTGITNNSIWLRILELFKPATYTTSPVESLQ